MPVFNGSPYVETAIRSLLAQNFKDFELIISDNCSSDNSYEIIQKYSERDHRIKYFRHKTNQGGLRNFEYVKDKAVGKYFMWAAHDDYWDKTHLSSAIDILDKHTGYSFVFPTFKLKSIKLKFSKQINKNVFLFIESDSISERILSYANLHHLSHKCNLVYSLFRKKYLDDVYRIQNIENDGLLSIYLLAAGKGKVLNNHTFFKRYNYYWPGFMNTQINLIKRLLRLQHNQAEFRKTLNQSNQELVAKFPEYSSEFNKISTAYMVDSCQKGYKIINDVRFDVPER